MNTYQEFHGTCDSIKFLNFHGAYNNMNKVSNHSLYNVKLKKKERGDLIWYYQISNTGVVSCSGCVNILQSK